MPNERVLMGKLKIFGKRPGEKQLGWVYEQSKFLFKANESAKYTQDYDDFCRQVVTASVAIAKDSEGAKLTAKFKDIKFMVDVVPTTGGGFFVPYGEEATSCYELPDREGVGAVIVWDPTKAFSHSNTADGSKTEYPPWVILAHEMGHAIQFHESGKSGKTWFNNYAANQESVEMDNISRHETPIVESLGLKPRTKYK